MIESLTCNPKVVGWVSGPAGTVGGRSECPALSLSSIPRLRWYPWARHRTPTAPRAPQHWLPTALGVCSWVCVWCVCVCVCVCSLGWVKCRAQIPSMGHYNWPHVTSLSLSRWCQLGHNRLHNTPPEQHIDNSLLRNIGPAHWHSVTDDWHLINTECERCIKIILSCTDTVQMCVCFLTFALTCFDLNILFPSLYNYQKDPSVRSKWIVYSWQVLKDLRLKKLFVQKNVLTL